MRRESGASSSELRFDASPWQQVNEEQSLRFDPAEQDVWIHDSADSVSKITLLHVIQRRVLIHHYYVTFDFKMSIYWAVTWRGQTAARWIKHIRLRFRPTVPKPLDVCFTCKKSGSAAFTFQRVNSKIVTEMLSNRIKMRHIFKKLTSKPHLIHLIITWSLISVWCV